jgi:nicotinamidase/pyrazinamidase
MKLPVEALIVSKADNKDKDAYSMFDETDMAEQLKAAGVDEIIVCGLATDYCVKATALDGVQTGLKVSVVENAIRGVEVKPGDSKKALEEMEEAGVQLTSSSEA